VHVQLGVGVLVSREVVSEVANGGISGEPVRWDGECHGLGQVRLGYETVGGKVGWVYGFVNGAQVG